MKSWEWTDWLLEVWGAIGERHAELGSKDSLADWEKLIDILGYSEYCISNAGDFANMEVINPNFQSDAVRIADKLEMQNTVQMFSQSELDLQEHFEDTFNEVCSEIANHVAHLPESGSVGDVSKSWAEKCSKKSS